MKNFGNTFAIEKQAIEMKITRAPRNRTLVCSNEEMIELAREVMEIAGPTTVQQITNRVAKGNIFEVAQYLPEAFVDLLILDPPYNLSKNFNGDVFKEKEGGEYKDWFRNLVNTVMPMLKPHATIYICSDWKTSTLIFPVLDSEFHVRNRITWEREKGRGAKTNWKNNTEDIWFCTKSEDYHFDIDSVKLKRKVVAPYRDNGKPKDWKEEINGNYRLTHPSNLWADITIPFWSMPENTDHPTQKPEKLIAKLILASSRKNDFVFDPFLGSGTTAAVSAKLHRQWLGIDLNAEYLCWALKRIKAAKSDGKIQGYANGVFWERNSLVDQNKGVAEVLSERNS